MVLEQLYGLFSPFTVWHVFILGAIGVGIIQVIIRMAYARDPVPGRIGDYHMYMFNLVHPQKWKCTLFRLDPTVTPALEKVFAAKGTPELSEMFRKNQGRLYFYLARHMPMPTGTITSGYSIIATNADLDTSEYHKTWEDHWLSFRGYSSRVRDVAQSGLEGMFMPDKVYSPLVRRKVSLIYYDAKPIVKNPTVDPAKIEFLRVVLGSVSQLMTWNKTAQDEENKDVIIKELQSAKKNAVGRGAALQAHLNESEWARFNKRPDQIQGFIQQATVNPYMAVAGVGLLMLMVGEAVKTQTTEFSSIFWGLLALGIGIGGVYIASKLTGKPRV